ncbi:uncharacterized protein LOC111258491 [Setaria italica]|uniref:uncharacterized protein LOC111258491 n=1 Tax=Setaria italica TaxID=4555 RepID=UPI000BE56ECC|nr:uncharacterized protein LOC111258491 [Setaria italica]
MEDSAVGQSSAASGNMVQTILTSMPATNTDTIAVISSTLVVEITIRCAPPSRSSSSPTIEPVTGASMLPEVTVMPPNSTISASRMSEEVAPQDQEGSNHDQSAVVPQVGMSFKSKDDAYEMYNAYARTIGFSIRKNTTRQKNIDRMEVYIRST